MQGVVSEFQYKLDMDLEENICARFAHHVVSFRYKNLRDKISSAFLLLSKKDNVMDCPSERQKDFESLFLQKQWAVQRTKRAEQSCWRSQRGLPEKSVSVLRKWMFQNFLCPWEKLFSTCKLYHDFSFIYVESLIWFCFRYPKDHEKDLLATKSGLTRNQVILFVVISYV